MERLVILTPWLIVDMEFKHFEVEEDYPTQDLGEMVVDSTNAPSDNVIPEPNSVSVEYLCSDPARADAIEADNKYLVLIREPA